MFTLIALSLMAVGDAQYHPTFTAMVQAVNQERAKARKAPVQPVPGLMKASTLHAQQMARSGNLRHSRYRVAEIIAAGQRNVPNVVRSWMNSRGHRVVILGNYKYVGAAGYMMKGGTRYWCMQFSNTAYGMQTKQQQWSGSTPEYSSGTT